MNRNSNDQTSAYTQVPNQASNNVSVIDFGADPTGQTDSADAFQAAIDFCSGKVEGTHGLKLHVPGGYYLVSKPLNYTWYATSGLVDDNVRRLTIEGDGSANTFIDYTGPEGTALLTVDGGEKDPHLRFSISGMRFQRAASVPRKQAWGLYVKNVSICKIEELDCHWFYHGVVFHDVLQCHMQHCQMGANTLGLVAGRLKWTNCNVFTLDHVMFGGNSEGGLFITNCANWLLLNCSFEGTGSDDSASANQASIRYVGGPNEGGTGLHMIGGYMENNKVLHDITIESNDAIPGTHIIEGVTFQRVNVERHATNHVNVSPNNVNGPMNIHLRANTFKFLGGDEPQVNQHSVIVQQPNATIYDEGNFYDRRQLPNYTKSPAVGWNNRLVCVAKVTPAGELIGIGFNAKAVSKAGKGVYRIAFIKSLASPILYATASLEGNAGTAFVSAYDTSYIEITTLDTTFTAKDLAFNVMVNGLML